jgi:hypothetical protein
VDDGLHAARADTSAAARQEQRRRVLGARALAELVAPGEVAAESTRRAGTELELSRALRAHDAEHPRRRVEAAHVERAEFRHGDTDAVEDLEHRSIAKCEDAVPLWRLDNGGRVVRREDIGQRPHDLGQQYLERWVRGELAALAQHAEELPRCRDLSRARRGHARQRECAQPRAEELLVDLADAHVGAGVLPRERQELRDVARVRVDRVARAPLEGAEPEAERRHEPRSC